VKNLFSSSLDMLAKHRLYLYRYALSKLRHTGAAEDVVQETLLAAVEGQERFRGDSAPLTWLTGILKHKIVDWQRREASNPVKLAPAGIEVDDEVDPMPDALFDAEGRWVNPPSPWPSPEQSFENQRFWEMLQDCLGELSPSAARAFYLREVAGMDTEAICAEMGISESNCWVLLHRARLGLREKIAERWFGRDESPARAGASARPASPRGRPAKARAAARTLGFA